MKRTVIVTIGALAVVLVLGIAALWSYLLYREAQEQIVAKDQTIQELRESMAQVGAELDQNKTEANSLRAANTALNEKIAKALPRAEIIDDIFKLGVAASQGRATDPQQALGFVQKLGALNDPVINQRFGNIARNPTDQAASVDLILYLTSGLVSSLR